MTRRSSAWAVLRAVWIRVRQSPVRRGGWWWLSVPLAVVLVYGVYRFIHLPVFAIEQVLVEGELKRCSVDDLRAGVFGNLPGNFFTLDLEETREALEKVPWVRQARVRRVWPDRLVVHIEEHQPMAVWREPGVPDHLVNRFGEIFEANLGDVDNLPELEGLRSQLGQVIDMHGRLQALLRRSNMEPSRVSLSPRGSWEVELKRGELIKLGRGSDEDVLAKVERFAQAIQRPGAQWAGRNWDRADLRHMDGFALHLTTTAPGQAAQ